MSGNNGQKRREDRLREAATASARGAAGVMAEKIVGNLSAMHTNVTNLGNTINATIEAQNRQAVTTLVIKELLVEKGLISLEELNKRILAKRETMLTVDGDAVIEPPVGGKETGNAEGQEDQSGTHRSVAEGSQGGGTAETAGSSDAGEATPGGQA